MQQNCTLIRFIYIRAISEQINLKGDSFIMITYDRLWQTMKEKDISQYKLIIDYNFSRGQIARLKQNESITTHTINKLCNILDCNVEDIMEFHKDENIIY